jgi:hypothetical protein
MRSISIDSLFAKLPKYGTLPDESMKFMETIMELAESGSVSGHALIDLLHLHLKSVLAALRTKQ